MRKFFLIILLSLGLTSISYAGIGGEKKWDEGGNLEVAPDLKSSYIQLIAQHISDEWRYMGAEEEVWIELN